MSDSFVSGHVWTVLEEWEQAVLAYTLQLSELEGSTSEEELLSEDPSLSGPFALYFGRSKSRIMLRRFPEAISDLRKCSAILDASLTSVTLPTSSLVRIRGSVKFFTALSLMEQHGGPASESGFDVKLDPHGTLDDDFAEALTCLSQASDTLASEKHPSLKDLRMKVSSLKKECMAIQKKRRELRKKPASPVKGSTPTTLTSSKKSTQSQTKPTKKPVTEEDNTVVESVDDSTLTGSGSCSSDSKSEESTPTVTSSRSELRFGWYQSATTVTYTLYVKGLTKDRVNVEYFSGNDSSSVSSVADSVTITLDLSISDSTPKKDASQFETYKNTLLNVSEEDGTNVVKHTHNIQLFGLVDPQQCLFSVNKFKVTLTLYKADSLHWESVSRTVDDAKSASSVSSPAGGSGMSSSSSVSQPWTTKKDWDMVDKLAEMELASEKPEGEAALHSLFQQIYANGSEEQKRAMMKSFQTSGGTVLSTNWDDVKDKDYEGKDRVLPTGQEVKKWEY